MTLSRQKSSNVWKNPASRNAASSKGWNQDYTEASRRIFSFPKSITEYIYLDYIDFSHDRVEKRYTQPSEAGTKFNHKDSKDTKLRVL